MLTGVVLVLAAILVGRLYHVQVIKHDEFVARGEQQYVHTVEDLYDRGSIYFTTRDGEKVSAATVQSGFVLAIDPTKIIDAGAAYQSLSAVVPIDEVLFLERAALPNRTYVEIDSQVDASTAEAIQALNIPGVSLYRNRWRYYPGETLLARSVGFVGYDSEKVDTLTGRYGLERYYDDMLARDNERLSVNFFAEIFSNLGTLIFDAEETRSGDIVTTLEPTVSRMLQNELKNVQDEWGSAVTGGIIIDPKTGAIYALDAVPTFNLNDRGEATIEDFQNPLVENVYELGSIIKALTMAAGIDSGAVSRSTTYYDAGYIDLDTFTIKNFDGIGRGTVSMQEVLNQSLNTGVSFIVTQMGKSKFREYFKKLQLGSETGIDLPNEAHGLIENLESPRDVEYATASFGQGIALTPIATVRALSALGNGGTLVSPHIVSSIEYLDGTEKEIVYPKGEQVFTPQTSEEISRMLTTVVDEALRGGKVKMSNYSIAAKTGTAQIANASKGGYYDDRFLHSFFGYFPSYDPKFLVFLYTVEPKGAEYASETLTDSFMEIAKFLINYYNLPPDR